MAFQQISETSSIESNSIKILIVDDEVDIRKELSERCLLEGFNPLIACSTNEALHVLERNPIDVLITDIRMPQESGLILMEQITMKGLQPIIFIMTAYNDIHLNEAYLLGASALFTKPFRMEDLIGAIRYFYSKKYCAQLLATPINDLELKSFKGSKLPLVPNFLAAVVQEISLLLTPLFFWMSKPKPHILPVDDLQIIFQHLRQVEPSLLRLKEVIGCIRIIFFDKIDEEINLSIEHIVGKIKFIAEIQQKNWLANLEIQTEYSDTPYLIERNYIYQEIFNLINYFFATLNNYQTLK